MKAFVKVIISLVVFIFVFLFLFFFSTRHFSLIDSQYYQPSVVSSINSGLEKVVSDFEEWQKVLRKSFKSFSEENVVKRCMNQNQTDGDIALREKISAELMLAIPSMQGIRVVEKETQRIHFSTFSTDVISKSSTAISYAKYGKNAFDISYDVLEMSYSDNKPGVDILNNAFIFIQPFFDDYNVERGKIFFYLSAKSFSRKLINEKRLALSEEINLLTDDNLSFIGLLMGLPYEDSVSLREEILKEWKVGEGGLSQISNRDSVSSPFWVLITYKKYPYYVGRICDKNMFIMPIYARYFLITVISLISFLTTFLLLNMRQDGLIIARKKIQKLHASIIVDILKNAEGLDKIKEKIEYRRHDANAEIRKALGKKISQKYENEINAILEQSWLNIIQIIGAKSDSKIEYKNRDDEILKLLREILKQGRGGLRDGIPKGTTPIQVGTDKLGKIVDEEGVELVEELEEIEGEVFEGLDEVETPEEVKDKKESTMETVEVQELEEVEELDEEVEELLAEVEEVQELEGVEELEVESNETDDIQELDEVEEPVAEVEVAQELEAVEELELVEEFETVGVDNFVLMEEETPPPRPRFEEVDDYIEPDRELFHSQSEQAEDKFRHVSIGGLDFSYLDEKKDDEVPVALLEVRNAWIESSVPDGLPISGELEVIGDAEPSDVDALEDEEAIVNRDGVYVISELEKPEPSDMEFKNLVDSVIS